jgi:tRNA A37 N6-isopentenylltransferase MiaA
MSRDLLIVLGPTCVGKTDYSIGLAKFYSSPVISCDSRQIYKEMRIGTAVPMPHSLPPGGIISFRTIRYIPSIRRGSMR